MGGLLKEAFGLLCLLPSALRWPSLRTVRDQYRTQQVGIDVLRNSCGRQERWHGNGHNIATNITFIILTKGG